MKQMKDSGIEWVGQIPEDWKIERLQWHIEEVNIKNNPIRTERILSLTNKLGVVPYEEKGNQGNKSKENLSEYKLAFENTIVANSMNVIIGSVGLSKYYGCVSPVYYVFKAKKGTSIRFINYVFNTVGLQKELRKHANGILEIRLRVSADDILKRSIAIPSLTRQEVISDYLDTKCAEIDGLIGDIQAEIDTLEQYKRSVITEAVTKGLNPNAEMIDCDIDYLGKMNKSWTLTKLGYICTKLDRPVLKEAPPLICSNKGKVILRGDENIGLSTDNDNMFQGVKAGDLCIHGMDTWHGAIAVSDLDGKITNVVHCCDSHEDKRFIGYFLQMLAFKKVYKAISNGVRGNTSDFRSWDKASSIYIVIPSNSEQKKIADYIDEKCAQTEQIINEKQSQIDTLESYKKSVIFEYITGKKEVKSNGKTY